MELRSILLMKKLLDVFAVNIKKRLRITENIKMMYASKALCTSAIARILDEEGFGFDTVSAGEIYTVYKAGVDMSKVLFNGNNKSSREIELALDCKVGRFSVDNFYEAELLNKIAEDKDVKADILLRITPGLNVIPTIITNRAD